MKFLLIQEGLGHFFPFFLDAGFDVIDMYKLYTDHEIDFMLNMVERVNEIEFTVEDRITLYKMFRFRHFNAPDAQKPFQDMMLVLLSL